MQSSQGHRSPETVSPRFVVAMGVCGVGKTTTARALAARLGGEFVEADDLHPPENVALMSSGRPLDDVARMPWLDRICERAKAVAAGTDRPVVIACSALKTSYRDVFRRELGDVIFLHLDGPADEIRRRLGARTGHFMPAALLESQLGDLQVPGTEKDLFQLSITRPAETILEDALSVLGRLGRRSKPMPDGRGGNGQQEA